MSQPFPQKRGNGWGTGVYSKRENALAKMNAVPHSSRLYRDEWAAKSCRPLRLDFNRSSNAGRVVVEAAPWVVAGRCNQSALHRVSMNVTYHFGASIFTTDVAVKVTFLPELLALTSQFARSDLLYGFEKLGHKDRWRLVDEQMDVLGHQDVGVDPRLMPRTSLFQYGLHCVLGLRRIEKRETVKATEGDEVESFRFLEPFQTVRHGSIIVRPRSDLKHRPLIAIKPR